MVEVQNMKKSLGCIKAETLLFAILASMLLFSVSLTHVNALEPQMSIFDAETGNSSITISEEEYNAATPHTVNVSVIDVTDLFAWEIRVYFDNTVVNTTTDLVWYPDDHVFAGQTTVPLEPVVEQDMVGWYVSFGSSLMVGVAFTGTGTLCQINFTGVNPGTSDLTFSRPLGADTILLDDTLADITFTVNDGTIEVIPEFSAFALIPLLMVLTLVAVIIAKREWLTKQYTSHRL